MFVELTLTTGFGLYIQAIDQEIEPASFVDEEDNEEHGTLWFEGLKILLPFCCLRIGKATAVT